MKNKALGLIFLFFLSIVLAEAWAYDGSIYPSKYDPDFYCDPISCYNIINAEAGPTWLAWQESMVDFDKCVHENRPEGSSGFDIRNKDEGWQAMCYPLSLKVTPLHEAHSAVMMTAYTLPPDQKEAMQNCFSEEYTCKKAFEDSLMADPYKGCIYNWNCPKPAKCLELGKTELGGPLLECSTGEAPPPVPEKEICNDGLDNDKDGATDCKDADCMRKEECEVSIGIRTSTDFFEVDGKNELIIDVYVEKGGQAVNGEKVSVWVSSDALDWTGETWFPDPRSGNLSKGLFSTTFLGEEIYSATQLIPGRTFEAFKAKINVQHEPTGKIFYIEITMQPKTQAQIKILEAIQPTRLSPLVAGKKMVVMVGVMAEDPAFFEEKEGEEIKVSLTLSGKGKDFKVKFSPHYLFSAVVSKDPEEENIVRITDTAQHIDFFQVPEGFRDPEKWMFFEFYVDPEDPDYKGDYELRVQLGRWYTDPATGQTKVMGINRRAVAFDVYPSGKITLDIYPVGIGLWNKNICSYCVAPQQAPPYMPTSFWNQTKRIMGKEEFEKYIDELSYKFECTHAELRQIGYTFDGVIQKERIEKLLNLGGDQKYARVCQRGIEEIFKGKNLETLYSESASSPKTRIADGKTNKQDYLGMAKASVSYFKAVMPLAEEKITIRIHETPFESPELNPRTKSPAHILKAMKSIQTGKHHRVVGFTPTTAKQISKPDMIEMGAEGYNNNLANPYAILVDADSGGTTVMSHELFHTYCAIDEKDPGFWGNVRTSFNLMLGVPLCREGNLSINANMGETDKGTPIDYGFWVSKRQFRGTPSQPQYSLMGESDMTSDSQRWVSKDLYYGTGVKLGSFPPPKEMAKRNAPDSQ